MNWVYTRNVCLLADDHAVCFNCLSVIDVGKSGFVKFGTGFARLFLGSIFPNFCGVIWFYEINMEVEVDFCIFLVVYIYVFKADFVLESNWQTASGRFPTGRQLQPGFKRVSTKNHSRASARDYLIFAFAKN